ncbi:MAG TPA: hypothetical protein VGQ42_11320 [Candidatus Dormibacteraeota bacterium]|jgi:hypothetical protein|nr:hypothetical protein [Candidatus Dormibacteraeota bacterium]
MMRRIRVLLCLPLFMLSLQAATALTARAAATPDAGTVQCTAMGHITTNVGPVPQTVAFTGYLTLTCVGVVLDDAGTWQLNLSGQMSPGFCAGGQGLANVTGSGPDGGVSGGVQLAQGSASLQMGGLLSSSDAAGDALSASLTATPDSGIPCVNSITQETLTGTASISDVPPPPDMVACTASGSENYSPPLTVAPLVSYAIAGHLNLSCTNPLSDDAGSWSLDDALSGLGNCGAVNASGTVTGTAQTDGAVSGTLSYQRVGTMVEMTGSLNTAHAHNFALWGAVVPAGNCVTAPWSGSSVSADAVIVE